MGAVFVSENVHSAIVQGPESQIEFFMEYLFRPPRCLCGWISGA